MPQLTSTNPARNYAPIGSVPISTPEEIAAAVAKARAAQPGWQALGLKGRIAALQRLIEVFKQRHDDLSLMATREMGRPIAGSIATTDAGLAYWAWYLANAEESLKPITTYQDAHESAEVHHVPCGVACVIVPWNFPFTNFTWGVGQSLIAGNTVVFKTSEETPLFGKMLEECFAAADLPSGVFNEVYGAGEVGAQLLQQRFDLIVFTGSTQTGKKIYQAAAEQMIPALLEMGGSDPGIVFADANIDKVLEKIYTSRFRNSGQICNALKRLIVHASRQDELVTKLTALLKTKRLGDTEDKATDFGPLVAERQVHLLEQQVEDARAKGATVLLGGKRPEGLQGAWYEPTLLTDITQDMRIWREEVFGPVLPITAFKIYEEAINLARDTSYGLGSYIFTEDKALAQKAASDMRAGMCQINNAVGSRPCNPFGGHGHSGLGMENGIFGFHDVTRRQLIARER